MLKIVPGPAHALYGIAATRRLEQQALAQLPANTLMQRAGLAAAQLALALAPHAQHIWVACGAGNNGGDGLAAAWHLLQWGKRVTVTWLGNLATAPADTLAAYQRATASGMVIADAPPENFDFCVDALLGIGGQLREPQGRMAQWIARINGSGSAVLALDLPSGLDANTGRVGGLHVQADHTLSLLTLKPGLFTAHGRDAAGTIWLDHLGCNPDTPALYAGIEPIAQLTSRVASRARPHASHKGSFGDVAIVGGAPGMTGAALLAASAALHSGAGRVFVCLLTPAALAVDTVQPELMLRALDSLDFSAMTVVCGCGGGTAVTTVLANLLRVTCTLVLDADALNAIAANPALQTALAQRAHCTAVTVLTPHPLEAARLLGCTAAQIQQDRLHAAQTLSLRFGCTVVLKGSGSVIAAPGQRSAINPTGNARLATAGTGDVLAGWVAAYLAAGSNSFDAACQAVFDHGDSADHWPDQQALTAGQLASRPGAR